MEYLNPETSEKQATLITENGWEDTVKLKLKELQREHLDWIHLDHNLLQPWSLVTRVMSTRAP
jgi:hypothetical protein